METLDEHNHNVENPPPVRAFVLCPVCKAAGKDVEMHFCDRFRGWTSARDRGDRVRCPDCGHTGVKLVPSAAIDRESWPRDNMRWLGSGNAGNSLPVIDARGEQVLPPSRNLP